jgi:hypothetical protein
VRNAFFLNTMRVGVVLPLAGRVFLAHKTLNSKGTHVGLG